MSSERFFPRSPAASPEAKFDQERFDALLEQMEAAGYRMGQFRVSICHRDGYSEYPRIEFELIQMPKEQDVARNNQCSRFAEGAQKAR